MLWALTWRQPARLGSMRVAALLRGVNLGKRQVKMADLRAAVEALGHTDVATYLQSGNVVFTPAGRPTGSRRPQRGAGDADRRCPAHRARSWPRSSSANPYQVDDPTKVVVTFLAERRPEKALDGSTRRRSRRTSSRSTAGSSTSSCPTARPARS